MSRLANAAPGAAYIEDCTAIRETEKALLVRTSEGDERWVPKSCIHDDSEVYRKGDEGTLVLQEWFAEKERWI